MGINQFSDLTWEEFSESYLMETIPNPDHNTLDIGVDDFKPVDWSKHVSGVKD